MELADGVFREIAGKFRLDADHGARRLHRQCQRTLDSAAASFLNTHGDIGVQQLRGRGHVRQRDVEGGLAILVERLQSLKSGTAVFRRLFIGKTKQVALEIFSFAGRLQADFAFELQTSGRGAIEEAAVDGDWYRRIDLDLLGGACHVELDPVRHEVIDLELLLADRRTLRIGEDLHGPGAAHGIGLQR